MTPKPKTITVKAVGVWDSKGYLCSVETYGKNGFWELRETAIEMAISGKHVARIPQGEQTLEELTITFTIPQKGKRK